MRAVNAHADGKILVVAHDSASVERTVAALASRFDAQITCVCDAELCLDTDIIEPHDLVITELELPGANGLQLTEQLLALRQRPIIMIADDPDRHVVLQALRAGISDLFFRPVCADDLIDSVHRTLRGHQVRKQHGAKYRQMRTLVRRVLKERKSLHQRVELICQDLVSAQRRLMTRVMTVEDRDFESN